MIVVNHTYKEIGMFPKDIVGGGCVVAGTKIQTLNGLTAIEDLKVGDKVIHKSGSIEVSHIWNPDTLDEGNPECYEIEVEDGFTVTCSENHKFLVNGKWIESKDLLVGMECEVV
jgi:intein/homing endonuclease